MASEPTKLRAQRVFEKLKEEFSDPQIALIHKNPFELLIATTLSAQATDVGVNKVTPQLFAEAPTPEALAALPLKRIEKLIGSINYFHTKAKNIRACAAMLVKDFNSQVPQTLDELVRLPGVGQKTANVVLGNAFGIPRVVVDTHVGRLSNRLRFTKQHDPKKIETDLEKLFTPNQWVHLSHYLILHGRKTCMARSPKCLQCSIALDCPSKMHSAITER